MNILYVYVAILCCSFKIFTAHWLVMECQHAYVTNKWKGQVLEVSGTWWHKGYEIVFFRQKVKLVKLFFFFLISFNIKQCKGEWGLCPAPLFHTCSLFYGLGVLRGVQWNSKCCKCWGSTAWQSLWSRQTFSLTACSENKERQKGDAQPKKITYADDTLNTPTKWTRDSWNMASSFRWWSWHSC